MVAYGLGKRFDSVTEFRGSEDLRLGFVLLRGLGTVLGFRRNVGFAHSNHGLFLTVFGWDVGHGVQMADHVVTEKSAFAYEDGGVTDGSRHKNFSLEVCRYEVHHVSLIGPCPGGIELFCALKQPEKTYLFGKYVGLIAQTPDF